MHGLKRKSLKIIFDPHGGKTQNPLALVCCRGDPRIVERGKKAQDGVDADRRWEFVRSVIDEASCALSGRQTVPAGAERRADRLSMPGYLSIACDRTGCTIIRPSLRGDERGDQTRRLSGTEPVTAGRTARLLSRRRARAA